MTAAPGTWNGGGTGEAGDVEPAPFDLRAQVAPPVFGQPQDAGPGTGNGQDATPQGDPAQQDLPGEPALLSGAAGGPSLQPVPTGEDAAPQVAAALAAYPETGATNAPPAAFGRSERVIRRSSRGLRRKHIDPRDIPTTAVRYWLHVILAYVTWGRVVVPPSRNQMQEDRDKQYRRCRRLGVIRGRPRFVAIQSQKGGVGKTTLAIILALVLSRIYYWLDILVLDANKDSGTAKSRVPQALHNPTAVDLVDAACKKDWDGVHSTAQIEPYLRLTRFGTRVLALANDPAKAKAIIKRAWDWLIAMCRSEFELTVLDLGTGIFDMGSKESMGALEEGDVFIVATGCGADEVEQTIGNYRLLFANPAYAPVARQSILVITGVTKDTNVEATKRKFRRALGADFDGVVVMTIRWSWLFKHGFTPSDIVVYDDEGEVAGRIERAAPADDYLRELEAEEVDEGRSAVIDPIELERREPRVFRDIEDIAEVVALKLATDNSGTLHENPAAVFVN